MRERERERQKEMRQNMNASMCDEMISLAMEWIAQLLSSVIWLGLRKHLLVLHSGHSVGPLLLFSLILGSSCRAPCPLMESKGKLQVRLLTFFPYDFSSVLLHRADLNDSIETGNFAIT